MTKVTIYTDGACSGNPGPGGWSAILICGDQRKEISGAEVHTTNNRMEMTAPIRALKSLKRPCIVDICSDSSYLTDAFNKKWISAWVRRGWKKANGDPVENMDLWTELSSLAQIHKITWIKVRGHSGNEINEECDKLAKAAIRSLEQEASDDTAPVL